VFSDVARTWLPIVAAVDLLVVLPLLTTATVVALFRRPKRAGWLSHSAAIGVGFALGFLVLVTEARPALRVGILIAIVGLAVATMLVTGRTALGGALLIAAAVPWLLFDVAILADVAVLGRRMIDPPGTIISLLFAVLTAVIGVSLIGFQRQSDVRHPRPPEPPPADLSPRRWDVVSQLTFGTHRLLTPPVVGSVAAVLLGAQVTATVAHGRPPLEVVVLGTVGTILSAAGYALGFALVRTPRSRRALEPFIWLAEQEFGRLRRLADGPVDFSPRAIRRYVRNTPERPEDRWIRVDALVSTGDLAAARSVADRMPERTSFERFERAGAGALLDWLGGGTVDLDGLSARVASVEPAGSDERLEAEIMLATHHVRVRAGDGAADPTEPLRAVGSRLGHRVWWARRRLVGRLFRQGLPLAASLVLIVLVLDRVLVS
jgi:hypothetical protein